jgi:uracil-DNA glycosylase family 4
MVGLSDVKVDITVIMRRWDRLNQQIIRCELCPRLREYCKSIAAAKRRAFVKDKYWGLPVPNFGDPQAQLLIVGLAPAAHGGNRTGRVFTGDRSGEWLFRALHKAGFANRSLSASRNDGLRLRNAAITAACHCAPPDNKPTPDELANCRRWLEQTIDILPVRVLLALGQVAWRASIAEARRREWLVGKVPRFAHAATVALVGDRWLVASFHPSQQNTFTGKLTEPMFDRIFEMVRVMLNDPYTAPGQVTIPPT